MTERDNLWNGISSKHIALVQNLTTLPQLCLRLLLGAEERGLRWWLQLALGNTPALGSRDFG